MAHSCPIGRLRAVWQVRPAPDCVSRLPIAGSETAAAAGITWRDGLMQTSRHPISSSFTSIPNGRSRCLRHSSGEVCRLRRSMSRGRRSATSNRPAPRSISIRPVRARTCGDTRGRCRWPSPTCGRSNCSAHAILNGADVFALELSKSAQATLLRTLGIDCPRSITFNDVSALHAYAGELRWPALLKPDQGGSGARIQVVESLAQIDAIFTADPSVWLPDNLFLLQEYLSHDPDQGIVRLEFLGGELLYAMRVKTHGRFNLCPSPVCNPDEGGGLCVGPTAADTDAAPVEFVPYPEVPPEAVETARRIVRAARTRCGRDRVSRNRRWPARVLRHQRQLEPAPFGRRRVRIRSVRAGRRLLVAQLRVLREVLRSG